jgi:hypothetical protein
LNLNWSFKLLVLTFLHLRRSLSRSFINFFMSRVDYV